MGHGLFIVAAPGLEGFACAIKRLAQTCDIAVAKDRPAARNKGVAIFVQLGGDIAHQRLGCGEAKGFGHGCSPSCAAVRAASQMPQRRR